MASKRYLSNEDVAAQTHEIIRQLIADDWRPDYIVGITRGGLTPAVMISHYLKIPLYTLKVALRDGDTECNAWMSEDAFGYSLDVDGKQLPSSVDNRKRILIVEDINDTGETIAWIKQDWQASCRPDDMDSWDDIWHETVRFAVLVNNAASKANVDYTGCDINKAEDDAWIVFPWEAWWSTPTAQ